MNAVLSVSSPSYSRELALVFREHRYLIAIIVIYTAVAFGVSWYFDIRQDVLEVLAGLGASELTGPVFALCGYTISVMTFVRPRRLTVYLSSNLRRYISRARVLHALPVLVLFPIFALSFTMLKRAIPIIHPYAWDVRLDRWDLALHGGVYPWQWIQGAIGNPYFTAIVNFAYHLWFFVILGVFYWLSFSMDRPKLRAQFLLSFVIIWIVLGTILATVFSSVGPCFYGLLTGRDNPYAPLLEYLHSANDVVPVMALKVQEMLWNGYRVGGASALGISAMPSLHVASSVLLALLGWRIGNAAGSALTIFAALIMIGSVHLGWHYALDGYVGAVGAIVVWRAVGWQLARSEKSLPAPPMLPATSSIHLSQERQHGQ